MKVVRTAAAALIVAAVLAGCGEEETVSESFQTRLEEADQAFRNGQYEEAGSMYEAIAGDALEAGGTTAYVEACAMRARSYLTRTEPESGRPWLERAEAHADTAKPLGWSRYLGARGRFEWKDEELEKATLTFREMFDYCRRNELWDRAVDAAHMVALTGSKEEKFDWATKGIEMAQKGGMTGWLGPLWNNLGWDYLDAERYDEALEALEKAREYHYAGTAELPKLIADYAVAHVKRMQGRLGESREEMRAVFDWARKLHDGGNADALEWMGFTRWELGEIAYAQGEPGVGSGMLKKALGELERAGMPEWDEADWKKRQARIEELRPSR